MNSQDFHVAQTRRDKNEYFLFIAKSFALGSKCPEGKQHGAVAEKHQRVVSSGYNGPAAGQPHCVPCALDEYRRKHGRKNFSVCPAVHAETNCVITAAVVGTAIAHSVMYITKRPCDDCLKMLQNMHLSAVVYMDDKTGEHYILEGPSLTKERKIEYNTGSKSRHKSA